MTNCNIIIPTFNRPRYLQRILDYYSKYGSDFKIIVADSSSGENKKINKKIISSLAHLKIQYLDKYPSQINAHHKLADAINYAQEKYSVFCADDDFITPKGIKKSIEFLEKNPDFTVAQGDYIAFSFKKNNRKQQFFWRPVSGFQSIVFSDPKKRFDFHLSNYNTPTIYGVHRTNFLKMIYKELLSSKVEPILFGELLPSMLTLIYGKMKRLDVLYMAREFLSRCIYWPSLRDFMRKGKYDSEYEKFRGCLVRHLSERSRIGIEETKKVVDNAMSIYLERNRPDVKHFLIDKVKDTFEFLNLPYSLYEKMRVTYSKLVEDSRGWRNDFPVEYYDDFDKIKTQVITYSKNGK